MRLPKGLTKTANERGSASIFCLVIVAVALALCFAIVAGSISNLAQARNATRTAEALAIAEAGAEYGLQVLNGNPSYAGTGTPVSFAAGTFSIVVTAGTGTQKIVTSTGATSEGITKVVQAVIYALGSPMFPEGSMAANRNITMTGNSTTATSPATSHTAHARANGNFSADAGVDVDGDVYATGTATPGHAYGTTQSGAPSQTFPDAATKTSMQNAWIAQAQAGGTIGGISSTTTITAPKYINGSVSLSGNETLTINGSGVVYVTGSVSLSGNSVITNGGATLAVAGTFGQSGGTVYKATAATGSTGLVSFSSADPAITIAGNADATAHGLVWAANGGVKVNGNGVVTGAIIAGGATSGNITFVGNVALTYPDGLVPSSTVLPKLPGLISWQEQ